MFHIFVYFQCFSIYVHLFDIYLYFIYFSIQYIGTDFIGWCPNTQHVFEHREHISLLRTPRPCTLKRRPVAVPSPRLFHVFEHVASVRTKGSKDGCGFKDCCGIEQCSIPQQSLIPQPSENTVIYIYIYI